MSIRSKMQQRRLAREVARDKWISLGGLHTSSVELEAAFRADERIVSLDVSTILALVQLAIMIWQVWSKMKVSEPSIVATAEELRMCFGSDEGDHDQYE